MHLLHLGLEAQEKARRLIGTTMEKPKDKHVRKARAHGLVVIHHPDQPKGKEEALHEEQEELRRMICCSPEAA